MKEELLTLRITRTAFEGLAALLLKNPQLTWTSGILIELRIEEERDGELSLYAVSIAGES